VNDPPAELRASDLVELTITYGECIGYCTTVLRVNGDELSLFRISTDDAAPEIEVTGSASRDWAEHLRQLVTSASGEALEAVYGKPDSRDEGAATIRIPRNGSSSEHTYSMTDPPQPLLELHEALAEVLHAWVAGGNLPGVDFASRPPQ
jgi:hypothetical protein